MGQLEQFAKQVFADETDALTGGAFAWEAPVELGLSDVRPDGLLRVRDPARALTLPLPWSSVGGAGEAIVELKMPGDHLAPAMFQRALLRRQARQVVLSDEAPNDWTPEVPLWLVSPHLPAWLRQRRGLETLAPGVYRVESTGFGVLWMAANELPLREDLVPLLVARSRNHLFEFGVWIAGRRPAGWMLNMLERVPMTPAERAEVLRYVQPTSDPEQLERRRAVVRQFLDIVTPDVKDELVQQGLRPLVHQFERKLGRALSEGERTTLRAQLEVLGPDKLGDLVLDLDAAALGAWLSASAP
jgi:hypothetical protein